jgi:hypothetical protein
MARLKQEQVYLPARSLFPEQSRREHLAIVHDQEIPFPEMISKIPEGRMV